MNQALKDEMKIRLLEEKARVEEELSRFAHRVKKASDIEYETDYQDVGDSEDENASEVAKFSDDLSLENTLEKLLRDLESALARFEKGDYGKCKYCADDISEARLRARPTSSSCIACKKTLTQEV